MTATRSTKEESDYKKHRSVAGENCPFCSIDSHHPQFISETVYFLIIKNRFPYSVWDGQVVLEHLMIIPKVHTDTLEDLPEDARDEYLNVTNHYEQNGYDIYTRAKQSTSRSVTHHHTHFIKTDHRQLRFVFMTRWPFYVRLSR